MSDVFTKKKRSQIMSRIKGLGNASTELEAIRLFKAHGIIGARRNWLLFGKPDFVFPKVKTVLFVDGEFWHGHPTRASIPSSNRKFWLQKIERNKARNRLVNRTLKARGWRVIRVWQRDIRSIKWVERVKSLTASTVRTHML